MHVSTHPSSSAAKPTEYQELAADSAMLAAGVVKPGALTILDSAPGTSSGATKLTDTEDLEPSVLLQNLTDMLLCRAKQAGVKKLLSDTSTLREWQAAARPTNKQRDAMMKLGSDWHVPQKAHGKKRLPVQVAKNLEKEFIDAAQRLLENKTPFAMANPITNTSVSTDPFSSAAKPTEYQKLAADSAMLAAGVLKPVGISSDERGWRIKAQQAHMSRRGCDPEEETESQDAQALWPWSPPRLLGRAGDESKRPHVETLPEEHVRPEDVFNDEELVELRKWKASRGL
jgi:hypothetical protein